MIDTTEIEKKSLEAHVELCAERYSNLDARLIALDTKIGTVNAMIIEVRDMVQKMADKRNDQLISWGLGILGVMLGTIGYLVVNFVIK